MLQSKEVVARRPLGEPACKQGVPIALDEALRNLADLQLTGIGPQVAKALREMILRLVSLRELLDVADQRALPSERIEEPPLPGRYLSLALLTSELSHVHRVPVLLLVHAKSEPKFFPPTLARLVNVEVESVTFDPKLYAHASPPDSPAIPVYKWSTRICQEVSSGVHRAQRGDGPKRLANLTAKSICYVFDGAAKGRSRFKSCPCYIGSYSVRV